MSNYGLTANYPVTPRQAEEIMGQVVGPNYLGEYLVAVDYEELVETFEVSSAGSLEPARTYQTAPTKCRVIFDYLTPDRRALITDEHGREFVTLVEKNQRDHPWTVPEWTNKALKMTGKDIVMTQRMAAMQ